MPIGLSETLFALAIGLILQAWSWYALGASLSLLLEGAAFHKLRSAWLPGEGMAVVRLWRRFNSVIGGLVFGLAGIHFNVIAAHPKNFYALAGIPFGGVVINLFCFGWICYVTSGASVPAPSTQNHLYFVSYCITKSPWRRLLAVFVGFLVTFVGWLWPWCCVNS